MTMNRQPAMMLMLGLTLLCLTVPALADVLLIEKVRERMQRDLPGNGISMAQVESRYGAPDRRATPIGDPPIARWFYEDYTVYFEHDTVIESVLNHDAVVREVRRNN
jgi:hypothetical protein